jgi:hypothetical protein
MRDPENFRPDSANKNQLWGNFDRHPPDVSSPELGKVVGQKLPNFAHVKKYEYPYHFTIRMRKYE